MCYVLDLILGHQKKALLKYMSSYYDKHLERLTLLSKNKSPWPVEEIQYSLVGV